MNKRFKWLSVLTTIGMLLVLLAGALVTKTDSGRGCGDDWPLCNGKFIPAYTVESMIEYSHRAVTGVVGIMVLLLTIWVFRVMKQHKEAKLYASGMLFFTVVQAILGAMAVKWGQSDAVLALHFGVSLLAVASTLLLTLYIFRMSKQQAMDITDGSSEARLGTSPIVSRGFFNYLMFLIVYVYVLVYLGAYVRHTESAGGCVDWPLCNGDIIPELSGATGVVFMHRVVAAIFLVLVIVLYIQSRKYHSEIRTLSLIVLLFTIAQVLSGGFVTLVLTSENLSLLAGLLHTLIICGLFSVLSYLTIRAWQYSRIQH